MQAGVMQTRPARARGYWSKGPSEPATHISLHLASEGTWRTWSFKQSQGGCNLKIKLNFKCKKCQSIDCPKHPEFIKEMTLFVYKPVSLVGLIFERCLSRKPC